MDRRRILVLCAVGLSIAVAAHGQAVNNAAANESLSIPAPAAVPVEATTQPLNTPAPSGLAASELAKKFPAASSREGERLSSRSSREDVPLGDPTTGNSPGEWWTTVAALALVIALVFGLKWISQRVGAGRGVATRGGGAVEVLSRTAVSARHSVLLLRVGSRLLVVGAGTDGMNTLSEISDPVEVSELLGAAEKSKAGSLSNVFAGALRRRQDDLAIESRMLSEADAADEPTGAAGAADQMRSLIAKVRGFRYPTEKER